MNPGCRVQDQLNTSESTAPYIILRELNLRKLPGEQWDTSYTYTHIHVIFFTFSDILTFKIFFHLENIGQGHEVQLFYWHRWMANIKIYKNRIMHFASALTVSEILTFQLLG